MAATQTGVLDPVWLGSAATVSAGLGAPEPVWEPAPQPRSPGSHRPAEQPRRRGRLRQELAAIVFAGGVLALCAAGGAAVAHQGFAVDQARSDLARLQGVHSTLTAQLAGLQSPSRIERVAVDQLGMHRPAGYVAVQAAPVPPADSPQPATTASAVVPQPQGPAPGGAVAIGEALGRWAGSTWAGVRRG